MLPYKRIEPVALYAHAHNDALTVPAYVMSLSQIQDRSFGTAGLDPIGNGIWDEVSRNVFGTRTVFTDIAVGQTIVLESLERSDGTIHQKFLRCKALAGSVSRLAGARLSDTAWKPLDYRCRRTDHT